MHVKVMLQRNLDYNPDNIVNHTVNMHSYDEKVIHKYNCYEDKEKSKIQILFK